MPFKDAVAAIKRRAAYRSSVPAHYEHFGCTTRAVELCEHGEYRSSEPTAN